MKHLLISLCLVLTAFVLSAYPVHIQSWNLKADVQTLNLMNISVDSVNKRTGAIVAYVRDYAEHESINARGMNATEIPDLAKEYALSLWEETKDTKDPMRAYHTLAEYYTFMQDIADMFPAICQLVQIGTSVQNRPLYFMKISDNVLVEENEPELKYVSSMHGDEVVGYDMMIRLIELLAADYGTDPRITNIVNNTEIWICPMMNPDGYAAMQRNNANNVDLNRNYPMPSGNQHPDNQSWQQENVAMMNFSLAHSFNLSMNFHGGALVINYPWDYTHTLAPDDALLQEMSLTYSRENSNLYNSTDFYHGITNGADWYVITGSMQDWIYGLTDGIDITAEIGTNKWPNSSQLPTYWNLNRESLLKYIEFAQNGVKGMITSNSGSPLSATITVSGNSKAIHTDPDVGDYHRLLLPGTYQITASVDGFEPQTASVTVPSTGYVSQNFSFATVASEDDYAPVTNTTRLLNNYPNPFNPETMLRFHVAKDNTPIKLSIYNLKGELLRIAVNANMSSGEHSVIFNGLDERGRNLSSGVYLCRLQSPGATQTNKIILSK
ncbi:MAG: DUF2817 domain-containing protein [Candidatus Cloacimonetes bacterium]|nr:DUF2817 domain-containing protein [Candidatus Cloacimonadota bacterium]